VSLGDINTFAPVPEFVPLVVLCPDYQIWFGLVTTRHYETTNVSLLAEHVFSSSVSKWWNSVIHFFTITMVSLSGMLSAAQMLRVKSRSQFYKMHITLSCQN
jgi:hypothetical protein